MGRVMRNGQGTICRFKIDCKQKEQLQKIQIEYLPYVSIYAVMICKEMSIEMRMDRLINYTGGNQQWQILKKLKQQQKATEKT